MLDVPVDIALPILEADSTLRLTRNSTPKARQVWIITCTLFRFLSRASCAFPCTIFRYTVAKLKL